MLRSAGFRIQSQPEDEVFICRPDAPVDGAGDTDAAMRAARALQGPRA
jgi:hypothetical protein